MQTRMYF